MEYRWYGREGNALVEGIAQLKCLRCPLYQTNDNWTMLRRKVKQALEVWGELSKLL